MPDETTMDSTTVQTLPRGISREQVQAVIERVRPFIQSDGGDVELVSVTGNKASVRLSGHCVGCPSAHLTLHLGIETALRDEIPEFEELVVIEC